MCKARDVLRNEAYVVGYAAVTKDERNDADGHFIASLYSY